MPSMFDVSANIRMAELLTSAGTSTDVHLEPAADLFLGEGLMTHHGAAFLASGLRRNAHLLRADDLTGSQAAINAIHLDRIGDGAHWATACVDQGIQFARHILQLIEPASRHAVVFVISVNDGTVGTPRSSVFRFYQEWPGESAWLADDLELYPEAVLRLRPT